MIVAGAGIEVDVGPALLDRRQQGREAECRQQRCANVAVGLSSTDTPHFRIDEKGVVQLSAGSVSQVIKTPVGLGIELAQPYSLFDGGEPQLMARIDRQGIEGDQDLALAAVDNNLEATVAASSGRDRLSKASLSDRMSAARLLVRPAVEREQDRWHKSYRSWRWLGMAQRDEGRRP